MAKTPPYFPFYVDDWLDNDPIFDMGLECEGAYCRLLAYMWKRGGTVPDRPRLVCNVLRIKPAKWKKIRAVLIDDAQVFKLQDGCFFNERLTKELQKFHKKSQKSAQSANKRWNKEGENDTKKPNEINDQGYANALPTQCHTDTDTDTDTDIDTERSLPTVVISEPTITQTDYLDRLLNHHEFAPTPRTRLSIIEQSKQWIEDDVTFDELDFAVRHSREHFKAYGDERDPPVSYLAKVIATNRRVPETVNAPKSIAESHKERAARLAREYGMDGGE